MTSRARLLNRRENESLDFEHGGMVFTVTAGFDRLGRIAEIFLNSQKSGSAVEAVARDGAIVTSIALQFGADLETVRASLTRDHDGSPATVLGAALEAIGGSP